MATTTHDYTPFDATLLSHLATGPLGFNAIDTRMGDLRRAYANGRREDTLFRVTDRRLQALRKTGAVIFVRGVGWSIV